MGSLVGHVAPGLGFLVIGLWHLVSHIRLFCINPDTYVASPWFPSSFIHRHLELILIIFGCLASISMELVIGPAAHQPFDPDGTIPVNHLHNFEHATISLTLLIYAAFAIVFDRVKLRLCDEMAMLLGAAAFAQELLLFHLHSTDHMGVEGQFHWLLQLVVAVSLATTILGIWRPRSFPVSFVRSASIAFQGVWFIYMGCALWTPGLIPKGCFMNLEVGHYVVRCQTKAALNRAKSLVNLQFSWCMVAMAVFSVSLYLFLTKLYPEKPQYEPLGKETVTEEEMEAPLESQEKTTESRLLA
ncbi:transmembrane protein 45B-like [Canna indica]|uniref:Transmembrane protein 45B-like n=1 Tax=Canna indica TaxID=4628 RepID=A0AAQ3L6F1_9LILI|nr:transmembrane protein 45B-like [Canna indica]